MGTEGGLTPSRSRLARVDVADNDDVDMSLFLTCTGSVSMAEDDRDACSGPLSTALSQGCHLPMMNVSCDDLEAETRLF